jgi:hypothetical protein
VAFVWSSAAKQATPNLYTGAAHRLKGGNTRYSIGSVIRHTPEDKNDGEWLYPHFLESHAEYPTNGKHGSLRASTTFDF